MVVDRFDGEDGQSRWGGWLDHTCICSNDFSRWISLHPNINDLAPPDKAEREGGGELDARTGMESLSVHQRQARPADGPLPDGVQVQVTDIPQRAGFGEGDAKAHGH